MTVELCNDSAGKKKKRKRKKKEKKIAADRRVFSIRNDSYHQKISKINNSK